MKDGRYTDQTKVYFHSIIEMTGQRNRSYRILPTYEIRVQPSYWSSFVMEEQKSQDDATGQSPNISKVPACSLNTTAVVMMVLRHIKGEAMSMSSGVSRGTYSYPAF